MLVPEKPQKIEQTTSQGVPHPYQVRARQIEEQEALKRDIKLLEEAGCCSVVLEKIPWQLAKEATESVSIPYNHLLKSH